MEAGHVPGIDICDKASVILHLIYQQTGEPLNTMAGSVTK